MYMNLLKHIGGAVDQDATVPTLNLGPSAHRDMGSQSLFKYVFELSQKPEIWH